MATKRSKDREVYRLWREYLKRSEKYRALWDIVTGMNLQDEAPFSADQLKSIREAYDARYMQDSAMRIGTTEWNFYNVYCLFFGNVFQSDFEDTWSEREAGEFLLFPEVHLPVVDLTAKNAVNEIFAVDSYIKDRPEYVDDYMEPQVDSMSLKRLTKWSVSYAFVGIPIIGTSDMQDIAAEIKEIRDRYMKTKKTKVCDMIIKQAFAPTGSIRLDELKLYLDVYDLRRSGMKMSQVSKKLKPKRSKKQNEVNISRQFFAYQKKAKQIIQNVEQGYFPGKY